MSQNGEHYLEIEYSFYAIQVVVKAIRGDALRRQLHDVIAGSLQEQSLADKRTFYKRLVTVLVEAMPVFEKGFWDYKVDGAQEEFDSWCAEMEGSIATEKEEMGAEADDASRLSSDKDFIVVSLLFLIERGSPADGMLAQRCDLPEKDYFTRHTFAHLLESIPMLSFAHVQADAVYLVPGNEDDGLSFDDLLDEGYNYLKNLA
jgi:hypothetical protein